MISFNYFHGKVQFDKSDGKYTCSWLRAKEWLRGPVISDCKLLFLFFIFETVMSYDDRHGEI